MKRKGWPIWLLRDIPAFLGVMLSFWPLMILVITSGRRIASGKKARRSALEGIYMLLSHAEARLAFALWRQAYRRLGWHPRGVQFHMIPVDDWDDAQARFNTYHDAFRDMDGTVDGYVELLRAEYGISERDLVAHGTTDAVLCAAAHHELVAASPFALILSSTRSVRPSKDERDYARARGPPLASNFPKTTLNPPRRPHLRERARLPLSIRPHIR